MNHIFISHSHSDSDFAENLSHRLIQSEFTVWTDEAIRGGEDWRREIDKAINEAIALVVVMTSEAKASEYVTYEWAFACGAGVKVIPVLLKPTELHPRLESLQYLDFTNRNARPWPKLIQLLREAQLSKPQEVKLAGSEKLEIENRREKDAHQRMLDALADERWIWRSIIKLAFIGGVTEDEALDILRRDSNVVFGKAKSGRRIASLKARSGGNPEHLRSAATSEE